MGLTDKLDILMKEKKINKAELARESGIPYTTIDGFYKKGSENAKLSTLKKLCNYFNCSLDYLADDAIDNDIPSHTTITPIEMEKLVNKYRDLDKSGQNAVDAILDNEYKRCHSVQDYILSGGLTFFELMSNSKEERDKMMHEMLGANIAQKYIDLINERDKTHKKFSCKTTSKSDNYNINAANAISGASKEDQEHDNDIMNGDDF